MPKLLYQDEHLLFIAKPADLLSVPGKGPQGKDSVVSRLLPHFPTLQVVHRLDCATSGVMVLALNANAHRALSRQFQERQTTKRYIALVEGEVNGTEGVIRIALRCDWPHRPRQCIDSVRGKPALTRWQVIGKETTYTRMALTPVTGRSHQLRVHMLAMGHPILGDRFYANRQALAASPRLCLHAERLSVIHPHNGEKIEICAPCPF